MCPSQNPQRPLSATAVNQRLFRLSGVPQLSPFHVLLLLCVFLSQRLSASFEDFCCVSLFCLVSLAGLVQRCVIIQKDENGFGLTVSGDNPVFVQLVKEGEEKAVDERRDGTLLRTAALRRKRTPNPKRGSLSTRMRKKEAATPLNHAISNLYFLS